MARLDHKIELEIRAFRQIIVALFIFLIPFSVYSSDFGQVYLRFVAGDVRVSAVDSDGWVSVPANIPLTEGDRVWIPEGARAELAFRDGTLLRLDQNTALEIVSLQKDRVELYLDTGHAYVNQTGEKSFALETPWVSLSTSRHSIFKVDVYDHGEVDIAVTGGQVLAQRDEQKKVIQAGEGIVFRRNAADQGQTVPQSPDEWDQWNMARDESFYTPSPSARCLPNELTRYGADFDQYGMWVNTEEYGYVWAPIVVAGWAPYAYGRWAWIRGNYLWIPYEPWGWIPHHYGRWIYGSRIGWAWVPPRKGFSHWGPGYVGWSYSPTTVSWVPLAPRDRYYTGTASNGRTSVSEGQALRRFTNARVRNAVTSVTTETFLAGRTLSTSSGLGGGFPAQPADSHGLTPVALKPYPNISSHSPPGLHPGSSAGSRCHGNLLSSHGEREGEAHTALPGEGATRAPLIDRGPRRFVASRNSSRSVTGFESTPLQVGDLLVWRSNGTNGARTYLVSNLPQGPKHVHIGPVINNPVIEKGPVAEAGAEKPDVGHWGSGPTERTKNIGSKPSVAGDLSKNAPYPRGRQSLVPIEHVGVTTAHPAPGTRRTGTEGAHSIVAKVPASFSSGSGGSSRGAARGRR